MPGAPRFFVKGITLINTVSTGTGAVVSETLAKKEYFSTGRKW
jgi:hypothetical protein